MRGELRTSISAEVRIGAAGTSIPAASESRTQPDFWAGMALAVAEACGKITLVADKILVAEATPSHVLMRLTIYMRLREEAEQERRSIETLSDSQSDLSSREPRRLRL